MFGSLRGKEMHELLRVDARGFSGGRAMISSKLSRQAHLENETGLR